MSIILPNTAANIPVFRSNGKCYQRIQQGVGLTPTNTWEEFADYYDFKTYSDCEACHNDPTAPPVFPMSVENIIKLQNGEITSGGDPEDPIYKSYILTFSGTLGYVSPYVPFFTTIDAPVWDGIVSLTPTWSGLWYFSDTGYRFNNTIIRTRSEYTQMPIEMSFNSSRKWGIHIASGSFGIGVDPGIRAWYFKKDGWSFTGTYTLDTTYQYQGIISPTTITVTPIIP